MIVIAKQLPDFNELLLTLKSQYSNYAVYTSYSIPRKSIIVRKSAAVGAQITVRGNEIIVDACCPNIFISALIGLISIIFPPYHNFEIRIADFLKNKYNWRHFFKLPNKQDDNPNYSIESVAALLMIMTMRIYCQGTNFFIQ